MMACSKNEVKKGTPVFDTLSSLYIARIVNTINKTNSSFSYSSSKGNKK